MESTADTPPSHELPSVFNKMVGLQVRLALGGKALDPNHKIDKVEKDNLKGIAADTVEKIETKSKELRREYWQEYWREKTKEAQDKGETVDNSFASSYKVWKEGMIAAFSDKERNKERIRVLSNLNIGVNFNALDDDQVQILYDRYFKKDDQGIIGGFEKFKDDVVNAYINKETGQIDYRRLKEDLPSIHSFLTIFGEDKQPDKEKFLADIISQSIVTEAKIKSEPEKLIEEVNQETEGEIRGNALINYEKERLIYLNSPSLPQPEPEPKPEPKPTPTPETKLETLSNNLSKYAPQEEWFVNSERAKGEAHGIGHHGRVLVLTEQIIKKLEESGRSLNIDREAIRWAAVTHDIRRENDGNDLGHGQRAAEWIHANLQHLYPEISDETLKNIIFLVQYHDSSIPANTTPERKTMLKILEDADALDRVRFRRGVDAIDKRLLNYGETTSLIEKALDLFNTCKNDPLYTTNPFQSVLNQADNIFPQPQPEPKPTRELSFELAQNDKDKYKTELFNFLAKEYPTIYQIWNRLEKEGKVSKDRLTLDNEHWECESDQTDGIVIGTRPIPERIKELIIFEDQEQDYPHSIVYKFSHELSHKLIAYLVTQNKTAKNELEHLNMVFTQLRKNNPNKGIIPLANLHIYVRDGANVQAQEEITELVNMYLIDPEYLHRYLNFLTKDEYQTLRDKYGLIKIEPDIAEVLFDTIDVSVKQLLH